MKFYIFGTSSGTMPVQGRHHVSFAVQHRDGLYWFDAGETCAYTAYLSGADLMRIRKIVISHVHADHVGGLLHLVFCIRKLDGMHRKTGDGYGPLRYRDIELLIPDLGVWEGFMQAYVCAESGRTVTPDPDAPAGVRSMVTHFGSHEAGFRIRAREYGDGVLFEDEGFRVTALHNRHLPHREGEPWRSFGFLLEDGARRAVYSGDTGGVEDFAPLLPCDLLLMEAGHHDPAESAAELLRRETAPERVAFIHVGRKAVTDPEGTRAALRELLGERAWIPEDGDIFEL